MKKLPAIFLSAALALTSTNANAWHGHGYHHGYYHNGWGHGWDIAAGVGLGIATLGILAAASAPPAYYEPYPVAYYPEPVVYAAPAPVYYNSYYAPPYRVVRRTVVYNGPIAYVPAAADTSLFYHF